MIERIISWYRNHRIYNIVAFLIAGLICTGSFLAVYFSLGPNLRTICNSSAVAFAISFALFAFSLLNRYGAFDTLSYGVSMIGGVFGYKHQRKYTDLVEYKNIKVKKRNTNFAFLTYLLVAIVFLVVLIIFEIKFNISLK